MNLVQSASKQLATRICFLIQLHVSSHKGSLIVNIIRFLKCPLQNNRTYSSLSVIIITTVDLGVQWLSYSPLKPWFAGSNQAGVDGFFRA